MNWIENNHQACGIVTGDPAANNAMPVPGLQTKGWNPYDVWMTRINLPRVDKSLPLTVERRE